MQRAEDVIDQRQAADAEADADADGQQAAALIFGCVFSSARFSSATLGSLKTSAVSVDRAIRSACVLSLAEQGAGAQHHRQKGRAKAAGRRRRASSGSDR